MNRLQTGFFNLLSVVSPKRALEYKLNSARLDQYDRLRSDIDGINEKGANYGLRYMSNDADTLHDFTDIESVRERLRYLEINNGHIMGNIEKIINYSVGKNGLKFQSELLPDNPGVRRPDRDRITQPIADRFNDDLERWFPFWAGQADYRMINDFGTNQRLLTGALIRDGEAIVIDRYSNFKHRHISYCQQLVEIDRLSTPQKFQTDERVRNGIRFDAEGIPVTYYILKYHPGDSQRIIRKIEDYEAVPVWNDNGTRNLHHIFNPLRPEQTRGITKLISALRSINITSRYAKAELDAAVEDAVKTGFFYTQNAPAMQGAYTKSGNSTDQRIHEYQNGQLHFINGYDKYVAHTPVRPNGSFDQNMTAFYREAANAFGIPVEIFMQDYDNISFSNGKMIFLILYTAAETIANVIRKRYCLPTAMNVITNLIAHGKIAAPYFNTRSLDYLHAPSFVGERRMWLQPEKEKQAESLDITLGNMSPSENTSANGNDFDKTIERCARNMQKISEVEAKYGVTLPINYGGAQKGADTQGAGREEDDKKPDGKVIKARRKNE